MAKLALDHPKIMLDFGPDACLNFFALSIRASVLLSLFNARRLPGRM
jgi:hypothetical protein